MKNKKDMICHLLSDMNKFLTSTRNPFVYKRLKEIKDFELEFFDGYTICPCVFISNKKMVTLYSYDSCMGCEKYELGESEKCSRLYYCKSEEASLFQEIYKSFQELVYATLPLEDRNEIKSGLRKLLGTKPTNPRIDDRIDYIIDIVTQDTVIPTIRNIMKILYLYVNNYNKGKKGKGDK